MKFWKKLQAIGSVVIVVLGILALIAALLQTLANDRPAEGSPSHRSATPQSTQGL
jgi:hypothetical protein